MTHMFYYTIELLGKLSIRHEVHTFQSEVRMVDIWNNGKFYVLQFEKDFIGFSDISKGNTGFDTIPDEKFYDIEKFKNKLNAVLIVHSTE